VAQVKVHDNESIESAIRRFKRQVAREGIITDTKKHAFYLKPGERKRLKSQVARRRARKSLANGTSPTKSRAKKSEVRDQKSTD
jgi:small subunit ribosomal protein S21